MSGNFLFGGVRTGAGDSLLSTLRSVGEVGDTLRFSFFANGIRSVLSNVR
jgi:hypothetical protein